MRRRLACLLVLALLACSDASAGAAGSGPLGSGPLGSGPLDVLVFHRTEGFAHASIADGLALIDQLGQQAGWTVEATAETTPFEPSALAGYDVVVWLSTTGDVLDAPEQAAFESWVRGGGGYVGVHAAADCEYGWPWYGELLGGGAWFQSHPAIQSAVVELEAPGLPGAGTFPAASTLTEEWYNFQANPRPVVDVILTLDETSYDPGSGAMGADHPIAWSHRIDAGRSFYTALGHRPETYQDPRFRQQLLDAIRWAAGELIFADGFESGDLAAWSATSTAG